MAKQLRSPTCGLLRQGQQLSWHVLLTEGRHLTATMTIEDGTYIPWGRYRKVSPWGPKAGVDVWISTDDFFLQEISTKIHQQH